METGSDSPSAMGGLISMACVPRVGCGGRGGAYGRHADAGESRQPPQQAEELLQALSLDQLVAALAVCPP